MKTKLHSILVHTVAIAAVVSVAHAQTPDRNASGQSPSSGQSSSSSNAGMSGSALLQDPTSLFAKLDSDHDSRVTRPEFMRIITMLDSGGDANTNRTTGTTVTGSGTTGSGTTGSGTTGAGTTGAGTTGNNAGGTSGSGSGSGAGSTTIGSGSSGVTGSMASGGSAARTLCDALFAVVDADHDGALTLTEFSRLSMAGALGKSSASPSDSSPSSNRK